MLAQWFGAEEAKFIAGKSHDPLSTRRLARSPADPDVATRRATPAASVGLLLPFDPLLLLAVLGLCVGSLLTIADATARRHRRASRTTTSTRQAIYFGVGLRRSR